jgi:GT2 family glycosyltransferase
MNAKVLVSVIVPTHDRKDLLLRLLESLLRQSLSAEEYEIIVVCDGVTDGTNEQVRSLCRQHSQLRLVEQPQGGPASARNAGARIAQGTFLAFTDDDCVASPEWLERLIAPLRSSEFIAVEGRTTTIVSECTPLTHQMQSDGTVFVMPTCNTACRRDAFERIGGFEEGFPFPHNEDADLAWRLVSVGKVSYIPDAVIIHPPRLEGFTAKARWVRYFESEFLLYSRNPEAYRRYRSPSPWVTIYWKVFIVSQYRYARSAVKQFFFQFRPDYSAITIALIFARWWNLIRFLPRFQRAARVAPMIVKTRNEAGSQNNVGHKEQTAIRPEFDLRGQW